MKPTMAARIRALRGMTVPELREQYREVFGEETRSRHRSFLRKQIAWRIQANEEEARRGRMEPPRRPP